MALVQIPFPGLPLEYGRTSNPVVVIVHDWYGRLPWLEDYGRAIAQQGFHVLIPDLYNGWATTDESAAESLLDKLDLAGALDHIGDLARSERAAGAPHIGLVGFSMGGWFSLTLAKSGEIDAAVAYYATLDDDEHRVLPCPVQLHFAEIDDWAPSGDPDSFVARLREDGTTVERHDYFGTEHSFANASVPDLLDKNAAALAFARTTAFLQRQLID
jgi:carboxymethylenebutenolidase